MLTLYPEAAAVSSHRQLHELSTGTCEEGNAVTANTMAVKVKFSVEHTMYDGETMLLLGSLPELGEWNCNNAIPLQPEAVSGDICWCTTVEIPLERLRNTSFEYKYITCCTDSGGGRIWEPAENRVVTPSSVLEENEPEQRQQVEAGNATLCIDDIWELKTLTRIRLATRCARGSLDAAATDVCHRPTSDLLTMSDLPWDALETIFSFLDVDEHLKMSLVCREWREIYKMDDTWKRLVKDNFGRTRLVCGCACVPTFKQHFCVVEKPSESWRTVFKRCARHVVGLQRLTFSPAKQYQYDVEDVHSYISMVSRQLFGNYYMMERRVAFDGTTLFNFKDIESGALVLSWTAPMPFDDFNPVSKRYHCDIEIYEDRIMVVYYRPNRSASKVFCWHVPRDLRQLPDGFDPTTHWSPKDPDCSTWIRFRPPNIALGGKYFSLWNVEKDMEVFRLDVPDVYVAAWDDHYLVAGLADGTFYIASLDTGEVQHVIKSSRPLTHRYLGFYRAEGQFRVYAAKDTYTLLEVSTESTKELTIPPNPADEEDEFGETISTFLPPQGVVTGKKGPFLTWSNGRDVFLYRSGIDEHPAKIEWVDADVDKTGQEVLGLRRAMFANTHLVTIWTDYMNKTNTVSVLEPWPEDEPSGEAVRSSPTSLVSSPPVVRTLKSPQAVASEV
eukprot:GFYU01001182.1.p1 GENE.GFYU01001182.1~~GFYU01001182.1.p1  ORF type:complete len:670 (+),score=177.92 GFYU01001182.1:63-2072(+)